MQYLCVRSKMEEAERIAAVEEVRELMVVADEVLASRCSRTSEDPSW